MKQWMEFESYIMNFLSELDINSGIDLTYIAEQMHDHMEMSIQLYAYDEDIYDNYDSSY